MNEKIKAIRQQAVKLLMDLENLKVHEFQSQDLIRGPIEEYVHRLKEESTRATQLKIALNVFLGPNLDITYEGDKITKILDVLTDFSIKANGGG